MLTTPTPHSDLPTGWDGQPKWDGFRALLSVDADRVVLRSRRGTDMAPSFPEIVAGAVHLPDHGPGRASWSCGRMAGSPSNVSRTGCAAAALVPRAFCRPLRPRGENSSGRLGYYGCRRQRMK